nr:replication-relaxation family protein [Mesorhizobium sp.]
MPHDKLGRRSRFRRTPTGKRLFLTERDTEILRLLFRYRYLRVTQLVAFLRPQSEKRLIERLGDLYHEAGFIDRPSAQWRRFDARYAPLIYELSPKGLRYLETCGPLPDRAVTFARKDRKGVTPQFDHAMMIVDALAATELVTLGQPGQRFVPVDEILARAPEPTRRAKQPLAIPVTIHPNKHLPGLKSAVSTHVVPDGLYGIEHLIDGEKRYRFFALECENRSPKWRSTTKSSSLALKRAGYEAVIQSRGYRDVYGVPNLAMQIHTK